MNNSFILYQWSGKADDNYTFSRLPIKIYKGSIKALVTSWLVAGLMTQFKLEVIYEN